MGFAILIQPTKHAITELVKKLLSEFEKKRYTLGIFVNLPKIFDNVNHKMVFKNLNFMVQLERIILQLKYIITRVNQNLYSLIFYTVSFQDIIRGVP